MQTQVDHGTVRWKCGFLPGKCLIIRICTPLQVFCTDPLQGCLQTLHRGFYRPFTGVLPKRLPRKMSNQKTSKMKVFTQ